MTGTRRARLSDRSSRLRLIAVGIVVAVVAVAVLIVSGVFNDRAAPGTGDTVETRSPVAPSTAPVASTAPTSPPPSSSPSPVPEILLAVGDIAECDSDADNRTGALAASLPGTIATLGDTAYDRGTRKELVTCFGDSWGPVKDRIAWAVSGNHDYMTDAGAPLREYMGPAAVRDGRTYFSEDLGMWHVVVLDTNCGEVEGGCDGDSAQVRWLRDDLAGSAARCTVALFHHPRWSSGYHGETRSVAAIWATLADGGVDLVLNGHEHDYERFAPLDAAGARDPDGVTEIVVGTGGGYLRGFRTPAEGSVVRQSTRFGLVEATLADGSWTIRFVDVDGLVVDEASGACH